MFKPVQLAAVESLQSPPWYSTESLNAVYNERRESVGQLLDLLDCAYDKNRWYVRLGERHQIGTAAVTNSDEVLTTTATFFSPGYFLDRRERFIRVSLCSDGAL